MSAHAHIIDDENIIEQIVRTSKTVTVYGAKDESDPEAPAFTVPGALKRRGFSITPVNPKIKAAHGDAAFPTLAAYGKAADIVCVFRRSDAIPQVAAEVLALPADQRPKVFWMQSGIWNLQAAEALANAGIQVVQDRCLSVYAARYRPRS